MTQYSGWDFAVTAAPTAVVAAVLIAPPGPLTSAQELQTARVFTAEQATAGKTAFEKSCAACHMHNLTGDADAPALAGTSFMSAWRTRSTRDLLEYMSTSMPPGSSSLGAEAYESIAAYVLQSNGAVAGPNPLTTATAVPIGELAMKKK